MKIALRLLAILGVLVAIAGGWFLQPALTNEESGRRIAEASGCFACHGPESSRGAPNLGDTDPVPSFGGGILMMDAPQGAPDVRGWILDGTAGHDRLVAEQARRDSVKWAAMGMAPPPRTSGGGQNPEHPGQLSHPVLAMPAFRGRLHGQQVNQLVAFVLAQDQWDLQDAPEAAQQGAEVARKSGCFSCHGPLGLFDRPNPHSVKGYVPAWQGSDARELVRSHAEFHQWVRAGWPDRFRRNPLARLFLRWERVRMPAFRDRLSDEKLAQLDSLFFWVRDVKTPR